MSKIIKPFFVSFALPYISSVFRQARNTIPGPELHLACHFGSCSGNKTTSPTHTVNLATVECSSVHHPPPEHQTRIKQWWMPRFDSHLDAASQRRTYDIKNKTAWALKIYALFNFIQVPIFKNFIIIQLFGPCID